MPTPLIRHHRLAQDLIEFHQQAATWSVPGFTDHLTWRDNAQAYLGQYTYFKVSAFSN